MHLIYKVATAKLINEPNILGVGYPYSGRASKHDFGKAADRRDRAHTSSSAISSLPERTTLMAAALSEFLTCIP
jgi:hypothetical protein